jgi:Ca-activated chloride channel family protein
MTGTVIEKSDAEEKYEQAVEDGDLPVMLVKEGKDLYSARVGNLKPGDEAVIEIEYGQLLMPENGRTRISIPTTIAPRFGRDPSLRGLVAHAIGAIDPLSEYRFFLTLDIREPLSRGRITCPSHSISQQVTERGITVQLSQKAMLDRDFILTVDADSLASTLVSPEPGDKEACTMLTSFVPAITPNAEVPLQLKVLVDCSGSMAGDSMQQAKIALNMAIRQLKPTDTVSFSRFGSSTSHIVERLIPATADNVARLLNELHKIEADLGGTELDTALREVIRITDREGTLPEAASILLITDGEVWNIDAIVTTARQSGHQVFAIGVGSAPSESLVRELAEVTGGAAEFASPGEDMAASTVRLMKRMRSMLDLEITIELDGKSIPLPTNRHRIAAGETLHLWSQLPHCPTQSPRIVFTEKHSGQQQVIEESALKMNTDKTVARMGAAKRLLDISQIDVRREIALKYQLITEETNFFLVHEREAADKATGMPTLQQVGSMLAAGWGGAGTVSREIAACYDLPRFSRRQADDTTSASPSPLRTTAVWRREASQNMMYDMLPRTGGPGHIFVNLAQAVAHPKNSDNPLKRLADLLEARKGDSQALLVLAMSIKTDSNLVSLLPMVEHLESLLGDQEAAIALLLDWASKRKLSCVRLSRRSLKLLESGISPISKVSANAARAYLDSEASQPVKPLQMMDEIYDIPAFLRRAAD